MDRCRMATIFAAVAVVQTLVGGSLWAEPSATLADFRRDRLLARFDRNGDGQFDEAEKARVCDAFGGIDVPLLPVVALEYVRATAPPHVTASQLDELDNSPADNRLTNQGALLGRILFYDRQLSRNNTIACASCHEQHRAFADPRRQSVG